ncbi:hypothetical protein GOA59_10285 [Sinorhizobium meliloti]|uniref:Uncharacterized protein n=1 Tax=Rhizobium meliloti TaxID=382 RepID=A0A6A7ZNP1_RHIML|nr:hypothetical protein [Sinorhizobium meliloti]MDW9370130.1 hypothetical protein [Sinorhizobium meliloti]MDW9377390.1 hypothetical protein [Sinorhizobium meliloti]MDW9385209.1 hypothetical protein [Sinorhizobium meliloti]MDW9395114.1 hypothetical protein [Sinorhizobium meliloti]
MNVIDSKKLRRGMRAENRTHFSSSRSGLKLRRTAPRSLPPEHGRGGAE